MHRGLTIYQTLAKGFGGPYSVGNTITMADVCLMPQLWTAAKFGVNIEEYEGLCEIYRKLMLIEAFAIDEHHNATSAAGSGCSF